MANNIKTFIIEFGREPDNFEEVLTYITETIARVVDKSVENNKADALTSTKENIANWLYQNKWAASTIIVAASTFKSYKLNKKQQLQSVK